MKFNRIVAFLFVSTFGFVLIQTLAILPGSANYPYGLAKLPQSTNQIPKPNATTATFVVNSTGDGADANTADGVCNDGAGNCTLRAAIQQANATAGADTIQFAIGTGAQTISPVSTLPAITGTLTIDGTTQPGFAGSPIIEVNGNGIDPIFVASGLSINATATGSVVKGLVINRFAAYGIVVQASNCRVEGNFIGTNLAGTLASPNSESGVLLSGASNTVIGGTTTGTRNVISGNGNNGVLLFGATTSANRIEGNFIGINATGNAIVSNGGDGVLISFDAHDNIVGGTTSGARNIISGNANGVHIVAGASSTHHNLVQGNYIGTDVTGSFSLGNLFRGVDIFGGNNNTIGGTGASRNVISGNNLEGVIINQPDATANKIQGNYIGLAANGVSPLGNRVAGAQILNGAHDNLIGGTGAGEGNIIAFNGTATTTSAGIFVNGHTAAAQTTNNAILNNTFFSNLGLAIDLCGSGSCANPDGVTANDSGDGDAGANDVQNFPILTSANTLASGDTNIQGSLNSTASTNFRLEFFYSNSCDASGNGEGQNYLGSTNVTTNAAGNVNFNATFATLIPPGSSVTATATRINGAVFESTSEFSPCITSLGLADLAITINDSPDPVNVGSQLAYSITVTNNGPSTASNVVVTDNLPSTLVFTNCQSTNGGVCGGTGNNRTVTFASLAANTSATITINALVNCGVLNNTSIGNTASVSSSTPDNSTANNLATATTLALNPGFNISPTSQDFPQNGGQGTVAVTGPTGCSFTAVSNDAWITILSINASAVNFSVAVNNTGINRTGTMTIGGNTFTVNQSGTPCTYTLTPTSVNLNSEAQSGSVDLTTGNGCSWKVVSQDSWITITSEAVGSGNGTTTFTVEANATGATRIGTIEFITLGSASPTGSAPAQVANEGFTITQAGTPTAAKLIAFQATAYDQGVLLDWQSGEEINNLGFHLYRETGGKLIRITPEIVAGSALIVGSGTALQSDKTYFWWDNSMADCGLRMVNCQGVAYWLEDIDLNGKRTLHGPVIPKIVGGQPPARTRADLLSKLGKAEPRIVTSVMTASANARSSAVATATADWSLPNQPAMKIVVRQDGWYRITQTELASAGFNVAINPRLLQLYVDGEAIPMRVTGEPDGAFNPTDAVEFYGTALDTPATDKRIYWLTTGAQPGKRISQIEAQAKPGGAQNFAYTVERKDRVLYFAGLKNGERENFFGVLISPTPVEQTLNLLHLDTQAKETATIEITLQGVTHLPHLVRVALNNQTLGTIGFEGQAQGVGRFQVPVSLLKEGSNQLSLVAVSGASDICLTDALRITYPRLYQADNNLLTFTIDGASTNQTVRGFNTNTIHVFDITNANAPQEFIGNIEPTADGYSVSIQTDGLTNRTMLALAADKVKKPAALIANKPSSLRGANHSADLVIITQNAFVDTLAPLAALRKQQGYSVEIITVEDIYDEFSFGHKEPRAIKDFLAATKVNWKRAPRFVLLVGDASYDRRDYLGLGDFDFVPTELIDTQFMETASDDWLVDFNDDGLPEMFVGRLPVRTAAEATTVVNKLVNYDSTTAKAVKEKLALLVADKNDGYDFESASSSLRGLLPVDFSIQEILRGRTTDSAAKQQLLAGFNRGAAVVNYLGHGSTNSWRNLFNNEDVQQLTNQANPSFVVAMSCLIGYFPHPSTESLGERLLNYERGGAIAVWASSSATEPAEQAKMNRELFHLLFGSKTKLTLGEAVAGAKAATPNRDIRRTWVLLGDPSMRLK
ncbi:MAG: C25 family cysteine peptidase [Acidobacteriota bacterium]